ncbi:tetratricopeptide repeat-containing sensor histidine kinase [Niabella insulamsoli]|uniref:tetratricopeptide repeat-containing sensor histidine kinase n=1 Tax=Niabella insulamsoli TaxID=3144874 RepID=UPI0031FD8795
MKYFLFIFGLLAFGFANAQIPLDESAHVDSLLKQTQSSSTEERVRAHFELSNFYFSRSDSLNAAKQFSVAQRLSAGNSMLEDVSLFYQANLFFDSDRPQAMALYKKADSGLQHYNTSWTIYLRAKCWRAIAMLQQLNDDEPGFIATLTKKAMPLAQKAKSQALVGMIYFDLGIGFYNTIQYKKSNEYLYKAVATLKGIKPVRKSLPDAYISVAQNYLMLEDYGKVPGCLANAYAILKNFPKSDVLDDYYHILGIYQYKIKDYKSSMASLDKAIELAKGNKDYYLAASIYNRKFNFYFEQKEYQHALRILDESSESLRLDAFIRNRLGMIYNYARVHGAMGQYHKAYDSLSKFVDLYDSLENADFFNKTRELEAKFKVAEKEQKIAILEAEKKETALRQKNSRLTSWLLLTICAILLISFLLLYITFNNRKRMAKQKEVNYKQQLKEMEQQQDLASAEAMLEGEERERSRMARDLHDGLGGLLAGIKIKLSDHAKAENSTRADLEHVISQLDESVSELRRIARNMMPESLKRFGLEISLRDLCESLSSTETRVDFQAIGIEENMDMAAQIVIYRIIQEALSNAIRHADAKNILLQCSKNEDTLFVTIEDDGRGFDMNAMYESSGIGMSNIKNRVKYLKGKLEIASQPNEGTTINIEVNIAA